MNSERTGIYIKRDLVSRPSRWKKGKKRKERNSVRQRPCQFLHVRCRVRKGRGKGGVREGTDITRNKLEGRTSTSSKSK